MRIRNNISAMNVRRNQTNNNKKISSALEKLSSGYAINRAADDAAGLAISEKMRAQISGLDQATENCKQGINLFRTADGALGDVTSILQRMNELCIKAGNEAYGPEERQAIQAEIDSLLEETGRIAKASNYNGIPLLEFKPKTTVDVVFVVDTTTAMKNMIQDVKNTLSSYVNPLSDKGMDVRLGLVDYRDFGDDHLYKTTDFTDSIAEFQATLGGLVDAGGGVGDTDEATLEAIMDGAFSMDFHPNSQKVFVLVTNGEIHEKGDLRGQTSPYQYTIAEVAEKLEKSGVRFTAIGSIPNDAKNLANMAGGEFIHYTYNNVSDLSNALVKNGTDLANFLIDSPYFDLPLQIGDSAADQELFRMWEVSPDSLDINDVAVDPIEKLYESLAKLRTAINSVSSIRGEYGAYVNRLEHTLEVMGVNLENLTASESAIRDTDIADEMTEMTKQNILSQAAQAMLSQANTTPQGVLKLLQ